MLVFGGGEDASWFAPILTHCTVSSSSRPAPLSQLDNSVESIGARVLRTRLSAEESKVAAQRAEEAVEAAELEEARLAAEALAVKAAKEALAAAAHESEAQREREEASRAVAEAVNRAQAAEQAAGYVRYTAVDYQVTFT